jgi:hypothetical protein
MGKKIENKVKFFSGDQILADKLFVETFILKRKFIKLEN